MTNESTVSHTPLPWENHGQCISVGEKTIAILPDAAEAAHWIGHSYGDDDTSSDEQQANTRFIARAVNSHDALLAACVAMRQILHSSTRADVDRACDLMDAAIALAQPAGDAEPTKQDRYPLAEGEPFLAPFGGAPYPGCKPEGGDS